MNLALSPFTRDEFLQLRSLMTRLVEHLQSLPDTTPRAVPRPPRAGAVRRRARGR